MIYDLRSDHYGSIAHSLSQGVEARQKLWFQLVLSQLPACFWELDPVSKAGYQVLSAGNGAPTEERPLIDPPASLIRGGMVHPESAETLEELFRDAYAGKSSGSCTVRMLQRDGLYYWANVAFTQSIDADGNRKILGVAVPVCKNLLPRPGEFEKQRALWRLLSVSSIAASEANLTQDFVENLLTNTAIDYPHRIRTYGQMALLGARAIAGEKARVQYYQTLGRDALLEAFKAGKRSVAFHYVRTLSDGTSGWICATANLCMEPLSGDVYAFGYIQDANAQLRREQALPAPVLRDPVTELYTDGTGRELCRLALREAAQSDGYSALWLLEIRQYDALSAEFGTRYVGDALHRCAQLLRLCFVTAGIVTDHGQGRISILLPRLSIPRQTAAQTLLDNALSLYAQPSSGSVERPVFDVAFTSVPAGTQSFEAMLAAVSASRS